MNMVAGSNTTTTISTSPQATTKSNRDSLTGTPGTVAASASDSSMDSATSPMRQMNIMSKAKQQETATTKKKGVGLSLRLRKNFKKKLGIDESTPHAPAVVPAPAAVHVGSPKTSKGQRATVGLGKKERKPSSANELSNHKPRPPAQDKEHSHTTISQTPYVKPRQVTKETKDSSFSSEKFQKSVRPDVVSNFKYIVFYPAFIILSS